MKLVHEKKVNKYKLTIKKKEHTRTCHHNNICLNMIKLLLGVSIGMK